MAKPLVVERDEKLASFEVSLLERKKLYGSRTRVAVDDNGRVCTRATLINDGELLLVSGCTGQGYFTDAGVWVERRQMVPLGADGQITEMHPSTLGVPQKITGPVEALEVLQLHVQSVYSLNFLKDECGLKPKLDAGEIFKCQFNYSSGVEVETAFLLANTSGYFAIVGHQFEAEWCAQDQALTPPTDAAFHEDDLDFDML
ncbi:hypothetical protein N9D97_04950 [Planktomarina temperata]|nr:hypothetical protein [Planktomarina temperata]